MSTLASAIATLPLYAGIGGTEGVTGFPNIGTYVIFGVVLVPVYVMIAAWFIGEPRNTKAGLMGLAYLVGITAAMWVPMLFLTAIIGIVFFGGIPEPLPFSDPGP
ncbi:hypothetical protein [Natronobacterium gregoryi]|uniref:Uncharacterized protein n=2 Tax=Natronobacterium gregoryi TaxID=44930 RepID=L0ACD5_NATGS|nr:hypothetical protein [Natronobacterium gregoryi]AFZ71526.1 hypothetical protein Natgr_0268 [Natronobacterium gregoryi SP2]ELY66582.1 hypothetical protein C490_12457 [Natronobacterium gregoryi SP2]PLK21299.1 hypothetical protein CYV19_04475 [Natronobacterium gregoryi SP2]SFI82836.1 hypothetical protein SAMN05443661_106117 [Natronobacterium gregoryi]